ncbi:MAG: hypothetical protein WBE86_06895 [Candidatus Acidiferrales bacterium]
MKTICIEVLSLICLTAFSLLLAPLALSATLAQLSLAQLVGSAHAIVQAEAVSNKCQWHDGEIWTATSFRVIENWKGSSPPEIDVWMIGGRVGRITSYVPGTPRFRPGEKAVLFLEPTQTDEMSITAWGEGTFRIRVDARTGEASVTQDTAATPEYDAPTHTFQHSGIRDWPLAELKMRVLAAEMAQRSAR